MSFVLILIKIPDIMAYNLSDKSSSHTCTHFRCHHQTHYFTQLSSFRTPFILKKQKFQVVCFEYL